jgi:hypothetical protein
LPPHLTTICDSALGGPLLGDLLHRAKDVGCPDPIRELVSRNSPANPLGQVAGGVREKSVTREQGLGNQLITEEFTGVLHSHFRHCVGSRGAGWFGRGPMLLFPHR